MSCAVSIAGGDVFVSFPDATISGAVTPLDPGEA
jgi:hypothetical protein